MNQNHWLTQELSLQRSRELQAQAEMERLAQTAQEAQAQNLLERLYTELQNLSKEQAQSKRER